MLGLGLGTQKVNMAVFGETFPAMLANWVGDDSTQTVDGAVFSATGTWVDRIAGHTLVFPSASCQMYATNFGGAKAIHVRDLVGLGPEIASPAGISTEIQDYTVFFAIRPDNNIGKKSLFNHTSLASDDDLFAWLFHSSKPTESAVTFDDVSTVFGADGVLADIDLNTDTIYTVDLQGTDIKWYKNGVLFSTVLNTWSARAFNKDFAVLCDHGSTADENTSYTAEIRIYPALSDDQRNIVVPEMKASYGIA